MKVGLIALLASVMFTFASVGGASAQEADGTKYVQHSSGKEIARDAKGYKANTIRDAPKKTIPNAQKKGILALAKPAGKKAAMAVGGAIVGASTPAWATAAIAFVSIGLTGKLAYDTIWGADPS